MNCPKCQADMEAITFDSVTVDRCTSCAGLWLDAGELEALKEAKGSDALDSGDPRQGKKNNAINNIQCPRCGVAMATKVDVDQHHIHFESCPACKGMFLDAGEFVDLKHYTIADYVRGLFKQRVKKK